MIDVLCSALGCIPLDCLQHRFMQQALLGLLLLAPIAAVLGVQIVHFHMAFFSDAIGHSAFAGVALGLLFSLEPRMTMLAFGILVGMGIVALQRRSNISSDLAIGVVFSAVVAKYAGVGILPVVHEGNGAVLEGWKVRIPHRFRVKVLDPIPAEEVAALSEREMTRRVYDCILNEHRAMRPDLYETEPNKES